MSLAPLVFALALLPGQKLAVKPAMGAVAARGLALREKPWFPTPPPTATHAATGIEVTVGPLPSNVGGPADEGVLRGARLGVEAADMLSFFKLRTPPTPDREKILSLIKQLGSDSLSDRDAAQQQLVSIGIPALPQLRQAVNNGDEVEQSTRSRQIL
ncbi:MAG: hypothetical protein K2W96_16480, partial [Gemmataceae bacterium]|nr:hypothetical protein [Gemmataceae bacterium]